MALLTMALLTMDLRLSKMALLTMALLTMDLRLSKVALLTMALLTMDLRLSKVALLTMALLTMDLRLSKVAAPAVLDTPVLDPAVAAVPDHENGMAGRLERLRLARANRRFRLNVHA